MKKSLSFLLALALCCILAACGGGQDTDNNASRSTESQSATTSQPTDQSASPQPQETPDNSTSADNSEPEKADAEGNGILIVYFTYGENAPLTDGVDATTSASIQYRGDELTGNIGLIADMIANATDGELFPILTTEQYPNNYNDTLDVAQAEKGSRPELASHIDNLDSFDTVFLGYPNWWGDMPMAVYSFLDEYDLSGKTIVPFVSSGGSGFSSTIRAIESAEPDATVLDGLSISANRAPQAEGDVANWLSDLGY